MRPGSSPGIGRHASKPSNSTPMPDLFDMMNLEPLPKPSFFNTTRESNPKLAEYRAKARTQDDEVMAIVVRLGGTASPSEVWNSIDPKGRCPITSVRRAMTNLTNAGRLVKTETKVMGLFGRNEYQWKVETHTPAA